MATVLWRISDVASRTIRCELETQDGELYRLRILADPNPTPFFEHEVRDHRQVIRSSAVIHQEFKLRGWRDVPDPVFK